MQNIVKGTLRLFPGGTTTQIPKKSDQNEGLCVVLDSLKNAPDRLPLYRTIGRYSHNATEMIAGVLLNFNNDESMQIGTKGIFLVKSNVLPSTSRVGNGIRPATPSAKAGQIDYSSTGGVGIILDIWPRTSPTHYIVSLNGLQNT